MRNIGYATTIKVFENLQELTTTSVANGLLCYASTKLCAEDTQRAVSGELAQRLQAVVDCFVCALYYGPTAEVKQLEGYCGEAGCGEVGCEEGCCEEG